MSEEYSKTGPPVGSKRRRDDVDDKRGRDDRVEEWDRFPRTPLDERLPQDVWQTIYNKLPNEDVARLRGTTQHAQEYFAPVGPTAIRTVYTQAGLEKALRQTGVLEIRLRSKQAGDRFAIRGNHQCRIVATGESEVIVNSGNIIVLECARVTARDAFVVCHSGYVNMNCGSGRITGGVVKAIDPIGPLDCIGGEISCYGARYVANVSGGRFFSKTKDSGTVNASGEAEVFAEGGTVRASGGTVQAQGPAIVYASAGMVWAHGAARVEATGHTDVVGEASLIKAGGTGRVTARAGTTVIATDSVTVDADNTCTVYTVGNLVDVQNCTPIPAPSLDAAMNAARDSVAAEFTGW